MYTLYILKCADNSLYTGVAKNLDSRLEKHHTGMGSKFVRALLLIKLVFLKNTKTDRKSQSAKWK